MIIKLAILLYTIILIDESINKIYNNNISHLNSFYN